MRRTSKLLVTMLTLVVLFAVFAFSASAISGTGTSSDPYTGTVTEPLTLTDGSYVKGLTITGGDSSNYLVIEVSGTVNVMDDIKISGGAIDADKHVTIRGAGDGATLKAVSGFGISSSTKAGVVTVAGYNKLKLENVIIDANSYTFDESTNTGIITNSNRNLGVYAESASNSYVDLGEGVVVTGSSSVVGAVGPWGQITINGATITKNSGAGLYVDSNGAKATINSGTISLNGAGNASTYGGGVRVKRGTLIINGGAITNNFAQKGGGLSADTANTADHWVTVTMNGGEISNNVTAGSSSSGGGVHLSKGSKAKSVTFTMKGGTISGNKAGGSAGAIYAQNATLDLIGGTITGNYCGKDNNGNDSTNSGVHATSTTGQLCTLNVYNTITIDNNYLPKAAESDPDVEGLNIAVGSAVKASAYMLYNSENRKDLQNWSTHVFDDCSNPDFTFAKVMDTTRTNPGGLYIVIDGDVDSPAINIPADMTVTLKGKTGTSDTLYYIGNTSKRVIGVQGTLNVENVTISAEKSTNPDGTRVIDVSVGAILNIKEGAVLTGGHGLSGAGLYNAGTVYMTGGTITGNNAKSGGGGINSKGGKLYITGGSITVNTATAEGAGINLHDGAVLNVGGTAKITGNTTDGAASNVYVKVNAATVNIGDDFTGAVGLHTNYFLMGSNTSSTISIANLGTGYTYDASQVFADNSNVAARCDETVDGETGETLPYLEFALSATGTVEMKSANGGSYTFTGILNNVYKIPEASNFPAPTGYSDADFVGFVLVSNYGAPEAKAEKIYAPGDMISADALANTYATWVKVETELGAAAKLDGNGIRFIATVDSKILADVGINVKASSTSGDGFYRGMVLATSSSFDPAQDFTKETCKLDAKLDFTNWGSHLYKGFTGKDLISGFESFSVAINYKNPDNYIKAIAFRGYIEVTVGDVTKVIYSNFDAPDQLVDGEEVTYGAVHARTARVVIRNVYYNKDRYPNEEALIAAVGAETYEVIKKISGYTTYPA